MLESSLSINQFEVAKAFIQKPNNENIGANVRSLQEYLDIVKAHKLEFILLVSAFFVLEEDRYINTSNYKDLQELDYFITTQKPEIVKERENPFHDIFKGKLTGPKYDFILASSPLERAIIFAMNVQALLQDYAKFDGIETPVKEATLELEVVKEFSLARFNEHKENYEQYRKNQIELCHEML